MDDFLELRKECAMLDQRISSKTLIYCGLLVLTLAFFGTLDAQAKASPPRDLLSEGKQIFRFDTFGDEDFWGGQLRLHEAI